MIGELSVLCELISGGNNAQGQWPLRGSALETGSHKLVYCFYRTNDPRLWTAHALEALLPPKFATRLPPNSLLFQGILVSSLRKFLCLFHGSQTSSQSPDSNSDVLGAAACLHLPILHSSLSLVLAQLGRVDIV